MSLPEQKRPFIGPWSGAFLGAVSLPIASCLLLKVLLSIFSWRLYYMVGNMDEDLDLAYFWLCVVTAPVGFWLGIWTGGTLLCSFRGDKGLAIAHALFGSTLVLGLID